MKSTRNSLLAATTFPALVLALISTTTEMLAQAPSGSFDYEIHAADGAGLWNFSGLYELPFYGELRLHQNSKGALVAVFSTGDMTTPVLNGVIVGAGPNLKLRLASTTAQPEFIFNSGYGYFVKRKDRMLLAFDSGAGALTGPDRVTRTREESLWEGSHERVRRTTSSFILPVNLAAPQTADGNWVLHLDLLSATNKLSGSGSITFSNGEAFQFQVLGSYAPRTQKSKLVLKGVESGQGASLMLTLVGPAMNIESMRGTVAGQRIHFP